MNNYTQCECGHENYDHYDDGRCFYSCNCDCEQYTPMLPELTKDEIIALKKFLRDGLRVLNT